MDRTVVPDDIASARVAVHSFLFSTFLAIDGSESRLDSHLFVFGFLFRSTPSACEESAAGLSFLVTVAARVPRLHLVVTFLLYFPFPPD